MRRNGSASRMMNEIRLNWNTLIPYMEQIAAAAQQRAEIAFPAQIEARALISAHATR